MGSIKRTVRDILDNQIPIANTNSGKKKIQQYSRKPMIASMKLKAFFQGDKRTVKAKKNILFSIGLKGIDSLVYLLLVPVTLGYLNPYEYGIWLTLNSILMWIDSFDIGLGNGMRNKLADAIAKGDKAMGRIYVSTTFIMLGVLMFVLILIGSVLEPFMDWYGILGTTREQAPNIDSIVFISFAIYCLNFIFKFIGNVYLAMQLPAANNLIVVSGHVLSLLIIYLLTLTTSGSLMYVAVAYTVSPLLIYLLAYPITFKKIFPFLAPSIKCFRKQYLKDLFNIGVQFFLIQLAGILLFSLTNLLISHKFGPESVSPYNISYRYFSIIPMVMAILLSPMWSATTDAYSRGELDWIKKTMRKIKKILFLSYGGIVIFVIISPWIYRLWVGTDISIPMTMSSMMAIYTAIIITSLSYSHFLNGLGRLRLQTVNTVTVALAFYPLCSFLGDIWGIEGVLGGMCLLNLSGLILNQIQFNKIVNGRASGIWNK